MKYRPVFERRASAAFIRSRDSNRSKIVPLVYLPKIPELESEMPPKLEVLFTPAEFAKLPHRDLSETVCIVFDIFRATSTIVTALANGAAAVIPVAEIADALAQRQKRPEVLLAGERQGRRITADLTGGIDFDLGNSPREFTASRVQGKTIAISTTNGSRALRACAGAKEILIGSFLNLQMTADHVTKKSFQRLLLVCSGTGEHAAYEDILGAGAMAEILSKQMAGLEPTDSARAATQIHEFNSADLSNAVQYSSNGRRLMGMPELRDDVGFCLQRNIHKLVAEMKGEAITRLA